MMPFSPNAINFYSRCLSFFSDSPFACTKGTRALPIAISYRHLITSCGLLSVECLGAVLVCSFTISWLSGYRASPQGWGKQKSSDQTVFLEKDTAHLYELYSW